MKRIFLALLVPALFLRAADWSCLSGPTLDFHAAATGIGRDWQAHPPTVDDGRVYTLSQAGLVHCLDAATGRILWRTAYVADLGGVRPRHNFCAPIGIWHNLAYLQPGGTNGSVVAVDKATGTFVWRGGARENCGYSLPTVVAFDGVPTLLCHSANALMGLDPATGKILWKVNAFEFGQALAVDGVVLVLDGQKGDLVMVDPSAESYLEITRFRPLGGRSWSTFFTVGDRLLIRNQKSLACFKLGT